MELLLLPHIHAQSNQIIFRGITMNFYRGKGLLMRVLIDEKSYKHDILDLKVLYPEMLWERDCN